MADALWMTRRIAQSSHSPNRGAEEHEPIELAAIDDCLEVLDATVQGEVGGVPVGKSAAPAVVADQPVASREQLQPRAPQRATRLVLKMRQPVERLGEIVKERNEMGPTDALC